MISIRSLFCFVLYNRKPRKKAFCGYTMALVPARLYEVKTFDFFQLFTRDCCSSMPNCFIYVKYSVIFIVHTQKVFFLPSIMDLES